MKNPSKMKLSKRTTRVSMPAVRLKPPSPDRLVTMAPMLERENKSYRRRTTVKLFAPISPSSSVCAFKAPMERAFILPVSLAPPNRGICCPSEVSPILRLKKARKVSPWNSFMRAAKSKKEAPSKKNSLFSGKNSRLRGFVKLTRCASSSTSAKSVL